MSDYASRQAMDDIENLLTKAYNSGDWTEEQDAMLARWRKARGGDGLTEWRWWAKVEDDETFANELPTRDAAIQWARNEYPGEPICIVEARCFTDEVKGDETRWFADTRNAETLMPEVHHG